MTISQHIRILDFRVFVFPYQRTEPLPLRRQYTVMPGFDPYIHGVPRRWPWNWRERDAAGIVRELALPAARRPVDGRIKS